MPEISLPTKATQDLIKTETDKIASKSSQTSVDAVKTDTAAIKATTDASLDATISSRQANAGLTTTHAGRIDANISSRASQVSVDALVPPEYDDIYGFVSRTNTNTATWITMLNIVGKGIMSEALATLHANDLSYNNWRYTGFKLTVDGVVVHSGRIAGTPQNWGSVGHEFGVSGFIQKTSISNQNKHDRGAWDFWMRGIPLYSKLEWGPKTYPNLESTASGGYGINVLSAPMIFNSSFKLEVENLTTFPIYVQYFGRLEK